MIVRKNINLKKLLPAYFSSELSGYYDKREAQSLSNWVLEELTGKKNFEVFAGPDKEWDRDEIKRIEQILNRLKDGEPIQYILGYTDFYGLKIGLGPGVLIPRNETEELVEWIISKRKNMNNGCRILDIGCGSGAISIALAKNLPEAEVFAVDISERALEICSDNAKENSVNMTCGILDILNPSGNIAELDFDVIVSNPPYVLESQKPFLENRVIEREPSLALFVPDTDPLVYYRAIADFGSGHLKPGGEIYVEINELFARETINEFGRLFSFTELRQDIHGKDRMIKASNGKE